ncbi:calcium-activated BK potassium channel alpha subunit-domain-containing protein [Blakeslea trispora]|nr:calcium-activated BK potassium channel alpha subunit-domain-containing protein [Blakeslea trispora]
MAKEIICVREFKQYLLAMNCRCRGASTLLTNLLHQRRPMDHYDESWQAQYDDGSCNEIYMDTPPNALIGQTFKEAAWVVYTECQVVLFGIKTFIGNSDQKEILLNPGNNYILKADDICVYMCESPREVEDISTLQYDYVKERIDRMKARRQSEAELKKARYQDSSKSRSSSLRNELSSTIKSNSRPQQQQDTKSAPTSPHSCASNTQHEISHFELPQPQYANSVSPTFNPVEPLTHSISNGSTQSTTSSVNNNHALPPPQQFELAKLPTPRLALLTGNRKLVSRLCKAPSPDGSDVDMDASPACYLLKEPATIRELTLESAERMSGHILVCMHHKVSNIFKFIYNLRSPQLLPKYLQNIVFLCTSLPSDKQFELVQRFPRVYFMVGNCQHPEDLIRAGVKKAKQVVVMSEMECLDQNERSSDSPAIMTSHLLDLILQDKPQDASRIVNLVEKSNIRFMHLLQGKDVAEEVDVFYTPAYAAGNVVVDSLLSNVLLSQTYYKPDIVSVIKALCSMPGPAHDNNATKAMICPSKFKQQELPCSRNLTLSVMPPCFIDKTFACLFETLLMDHDVLPLGLLRAPDENMGNELSFVYTNPVPSLVLKRTDKIYLLASPGWSFYSQQ